MAILGVVMIFAAAPMQLEAARYNWVPASPMHLGGGFNPTYPSRSYPRCIDFKIIKGDDSDGGKTEHVDRAPVNTKFTLSYVRDTRELYEHLQIDASVSARTAFGQGGSANYSFEKELSIEGEDVVWILKGSTDYGRYVVTTPELNSLGKKYVNSATMFREVCGTEYVAQERRMVFAAAVFVAHQVSQREKTRLQQSFQAAGSWGPVDISGDVNISQIFKSAASHLSISVAIFTIGGDGITKLSELITKGLELPEVKNKLKEYIDGQTPEKAVPVQYVTGSMKSFGVGLDDLGRYHQDAVLTELFFTHKDYESDLHRIGIALRNPERYPFFGDASWPILQKGYDDIADRLAAIRAAGYDCLIDNLKCRLPKAMPPIILPPFQITLPWEVFVRKIKVATKYVYMVRVAGKNMKRIEYYFNDTKQAEWEIISQPSGEQVVQRAILMDGETTFLGATLRITDQADKVYVVQLAAYVALE